MNPRAQDLRRELRAWTSYARGTGFRLWQLRGEANPAVTPLVRALRGVALPWPEEERRWSGAIESLRAELRASDLEIEVRHHGTLAPDEVVDEEQVRAGRVVRRNVGRLCRLAAVTRPWGRLLFRLVREFQPERCLELGTSLGISAAYTAAALEVNGRGGLLTLEGAEALAALARENLRRLGLRRVEVRVGRHEDILPRVVEELGRIDFAYVDGNHVERAVLGTLEVLWPRVGAGTVLVLDDIHWSSAMERAWSVVRRDPRLAVAADVGRMGLCVVA